jgi:hypothetical protein
MKAILQLRPITCGIVTEIIHMKSVMQLQQVLYSILTMKSYTFEDYNQCLGSYLIFKNNCPFPFLKKLEITVGNQRTSKLWFLKKCWIKKTSRVERLVIVHLSA